MHFFVVFPTVAEMTALPGAFAVTFPFVVTVATVFLLLFQVTFFVVPVTFSVALWPSRSDRDVLFSLIAACVSEENAQVKHSMSAKNSNADLHFFM